MVRENSNLSLKELVKSIISKKGKGSFVELPDKMDIRAKNIQANTWMEKKK